ncbi:hypothetical protein F7725_015902, partial [Dissostichus mawsoni]
LSPRRQTDEWFWIHGELAFSLVDFVAGQVAECASSFDAEISGLERTVSEPPLPSACSSPVRMEGSPLATSSSSQESLVNLIQPVGQHKQVKGSGIRHLAF